VFKRRGARVDTQADSANDIDRAFFGGEKANAQAGAPAASDVRPRRRRDWGDDDVRPPQRDDVSPAHTARKQPLIDRQTMLAVVGVCAALLASLLVYALRALVLPTLMLAAFTALLASALTQFAAVRRGDEGAISECDECVCLMVCCVVSCGRPIAASVVACRCGHDDVGGGGEIARTHSGSIEV
jgi:hypothetical protein